MKRIMSAALMMALSTSAFAVDEWTGTKPIANLRFDGRTGSKTVYFETPSGVWSAAGCPNAQFVMIRGIDGLKELLSIGLAAKLAERNVRFLGACLDSDYFEAYYVIVE
jgi:hypothetical protein